MKQIDIIRAGIRIEVSSRDCGKFWGDAAANAALEFFTKWFFVVVDVAVVIVVDDVAVVIDVNDVAVVIVDNDAAVVVNDIAVVVNDIAVVVVIFVVDDDDDVITIFDVGEGEGVRERV